MGTTAVLLVAGRVLELYFVGVVIFPPIFFGTGGGSVDVYRTGGGGRGGVSSSRKSSLL